MRGGGGVGTNPTECPMLITVAAVWLRQNYPHRIYFTVLTRNRLRNYAVLFARLMFSMLLISAAEMSNARVWGRSLAGIASSNPVGGMDA